MTLLRGLRMLLGDVANMGEGHNCYLDECVLNFKYIYVIIGGTFQTHVRGVPCETLALTIESAKSRLSDTFFLAPMMIP